MLLLFTTNDAPVARLIRWGTREPASHFALTFDESADGFGILFHSHFTGCGIEWLSDWRKRNTIVCALQPKEKLTTQQEEEIYQIFVKRFYGKRYDMRGLAYWAYSIFRHRLFGVPLPTQNAWGSPNKYMCYEIAAGLSQVEFLKFPDIQANSMITPYMLKSLVDDTKMFQDVTDFYTE